MMILLALLACMGCTVTITNFSKHFSKVKTPWDLVICQLIGGAWGGLAILSYELLKGAYVL